MKKKAKTSKLKNPKWMRMINQLKAMKFLSLIMNKNLMKKMRTQFKKMMTINLQKMKKVLSKNHRNNRWRLKIML